MSRATLEGVKVGDALAVQGSSLYGGKLTKVGVVRVTATMVVTAGGTVFNRNGNIRGAGGWTRTWAEPWDEVKHSAQIREQEAERALAAARGKLRDYAWHDINSEQAAAALALIATWSK